MAILIAFCFAAFALGLFIGAAVATGAAADRDHEITTLRYHLQKILTELRENAFVDQSTREQAQKILK